MLNTPNSQKSAQKPWWAQREETPEEREARLDARMKELEHENDPNTIWDNIMRWSKRLFKASLVVTGIISAVGYFVFFSEIGGFEAGIVMALLVAGIIEAGKYFSLDKTFRTLFIQGPRFIMASPANTFGTLGLLLSSVLLMSVSFHNSTVGAEKMSTMIHQQSNEHVFSANTADIDKQIAANQASIEQHRKNKWKGTVVYESSKAITQLEKQNLLLAQQRQEAVTQQRSDFERQRGQKDEHGANASSIIMQSGGWVEGLQLLCVLVYVCSQIILRNQMSNRSTRRQADESENINPGIGFNRRQPNPIQNQAPAPQPEAPENPRRIGFGPRDTNGDFIPFSNNTVSQRNTAVSQGNDGELYKNIGGDLISPDELLKHFETQLRREPSNFRRRDALPETVAKRVVTILDNAQSAINNAKSEDFSPEQATKFADFVKQICLLMSHYGFEHDYTGMLRVLATKTKRYATA